MYERTKQLIAGVESGARDPRMLYEGKTKEEHEKALLEAAEAKAKGNLTEGADGKTEQVLSKLIGQQPVVLIFGSYT